MAAYFNELMIELETNENFKKFYSAKVEGAIGTVCGSLCIGGFVMAPLWGALLITGGLAVTVYGVRVTNNIQHRRMVAKFKKLSIEEKNRLVGTVQGVVGNTEIDDLRDLINGGKKNKILEALKQFSE